MESALENILTRIPQLVVAVVGDLFLDRYLDIDPALTEVSIETGLDAYQVVRVRAHPGAAGTVINNLVALGVQQVRAIAVIGEDGEGYELRKALADQGTDAGSIIACPGRRTPTYTKPMIQGTSGRELNRLDIKNRTKLPTETEERVLRDLAAAMQEVDAVLVVDQVSEPDCGVITTKVREELAELGAKHPAKIILADSRERIGLFRNVWLKPNQAECVRALRPDDPSQQAGAEDVRVLSQKAGRPVFCTCGERGMMVVDPREDFRVWDVIPFPVKGPIDPVGAGDSTSAAIAVQSRRERRSRRQRRSETWLLRLRFSN